MELGEKIRQARLEARLSQRELCGDEITRNMLSLIEHGSAQPSMKTLSYLARRLGKGVGYFLEEDARDQSELVRSAEALRRAADALEGGRDIYAAQLLEQVTSPLLHREKLLLSARIPGTDPAAVCLALPSLDEELLLRAEAALAGGDNVRCHRLLEAVENRDLPRWNLLTGRLYLALTQWREAAVHLKAAEEAYPEVIPLLETCFRELGDFRQAYEYACRQKG